jgi:photosystem II stability/assembly factor-like uncharacterized protein
MNTPHLEHVPTQSLWLVAVLFSLALSTHDASSQWQRIPSPPGGSVRSLTVDGSRVIAGTAEGIYISRDSGYTWQPSCSGLPTYDIRAVATNGNRVVASGDVCTLMSSDDGGTSWINMGNNFGAASIYFLASQGANFYAGTNQGLFRSTDDGEEWSIWNGGLTAPTLDRVPQFRSLAISGNRLYAGVQYLGLYTSTNGGASWLSLKSDGAATFVKIAVDGPCVYVADDAGNIWASTDEGNTWRFVRNVPDVASIIASQSHLYIVTVSQGILHSVDRGYTLVSMNQGLPTTMATCLSAVGSDLLVGLQFKGVYRLGGGTGTWLPSLSGLCGVNVTSFAVNGSSIHIGTLEGVFRTTDFGETWVGKSFGYTGVAFDFFHVIDSTVYTASAFSGLLRSTDDGTTWQQFGSGSWSGGVNSLCRFGDYLIAASWLGCYRSSDEGKTWTESNEGLIPRGGSLALYECAYARSRIVAAGFSGVFASSDSGRTWARSDSGFPASGGFATSVKAIGTRFLVAYGGSGIFMSTDEGQSWNPSNNGINDDQVHSMLIEKGSIYIGCYSGHVYCSNDSGSTWRSVGDGLPPFSIQSLASDRTNLFVSQGAAGLRYRPLSQMQPATGLLPAGSPNCPQAFSLSQNYPNPFNPSTVIDYQLRTNCFVILEIYDVLGREVKKLVNERQNAGSHSATFNAYDLPAGVYLYRLRAGESIETKKMILVK